jgi:crotonobetainyl-CoA:carnitine CoA-transferase CaiB-like acyl-CoA transferase
MKRLSQPLKGLKVVDASSVLAGPSVATYFAELGADVIKVEHPSHGDVTRSWKLPEEDQNSRISAYFSSVNFGKKYILLDLTSQEDHSRFIDLVAKADILIMNFKRRDYEKFELENSRLTALNPALIIGKISGYGEESDRVAYDLILQAESGFMSMNGQSDGPPTKMPVAFIDVLAAHHLKEAILLALYERERSGIGKSVHVSLYDAAVSSLVNQASNFLMTGKIPQRMGSKHPNIAPYGELFETKDGRTITFAIGSDIHFQKLCKTLRLDNLIHDNRFASNQSRVRHRSELFELLQLSVANWDAAALLEMLISQNVPAGAIKNVAEVFQEHQAKSLIREETIDGILTKRVASVIFNT